MFIRYFDFVYKIRVTNKIIERAEVFAKKVSPTVDYRDSNQTNKGKITDDHFISKIGEECVMIAYSDFIDVSRIEGPDYTIYEKHEKSWDEDLKIDGVGLGVKTQRTTQGKRVGDSWTFQLSEKRKDAALKDKRSWFCFVQYDDINTSNGYYCYVYPAFKIKELEFKDPYADYLKGKKRAVYKKDLTIPPKIP